MKKISLFALVLIFAILVLPQSSLAINGTSSSPPQSVLGQFIQESPLEIDINDQILPKHHQDSSQQKLSTRLQQLTGQKALVPTVTESDLIQEMSALIQVANMPAVYDMDGTGFALHVYACVEFADGYDLDLLIPYVTEVKNYRAEYQLATVWIDTNMLRAIASLDGVQSIREVMPPEILSGSENSEGDSILTADLARAMGTDGTGIKIGILSNGVDHYADAVASGDLPADLTILSNSIGGDEGTAMLEIVYDLAPEADLYFHDCGSSTLDFIDAIDALENAGCTIICDDVGWLLEPYFEDGIVAQHVDDLVTTTDVIYVTSAGNAATSHFQGIYSDYGDGTADFSYGASPSTPYVYVNLANGETLKAIMQWDEAFGSSGCDYNLYLFNADSGELIGGSELTQDGNDNPLEYFQYVNSTGSELNLAIVAYENDSATDRTLELYLYGGSTYTNNIVSEDSIYGHAAVPGVIACGAISWQTPGEIEIFSSRGPVTMLAETRQKPDIAGIDGVSITGAGGFGSYYSGNYYFYGTSAAAPHIAAVSALLASRFTDMSSAELKQVLLDNCVDLGTPAFDSSFGYGRADAQTAASSHLFVTYNTQGGGSTATQLVETSSLVTEPSNPDKTDYHFDGWYTDPAGTLPWDFENDTVTEDLMLYAAWVPLPFTQGRGTVDHPYGISTAEQLDAVRTMPDAYFILVNDIDLESDCAQDGIFWHDGLGWLPIGDESVPFTGGLDGDGFEISNLLINRPADENVGLFGFTGSSTITGLTLNEADITGASGGAVAGSSAGSITHCRVSGSITGAADGTSGTGGLIGDLTGDLSQCSNLAAITGAAAGGLAGTATGDITLSANHGSVTGLGLDAIGGIAGKTTGSISDCYNTGDLFLVESEAVSGGIAGWQGDLGTAYENCYSIGLAIYGITASTDNTAACTNCYFLDTSADNLNGYGTPKTASELEVAASYTGFDFSSTWTMDGEPSYLYAQLQPVAHPSPKSDVIESSIYEINEADSLLLGVSVNTSVSELLSNLDNSAEDIKVFDADGNMYTGDTVATGMVVKLIFDSEIKDELSISILGDISGDGIIDITDILYVRADILNTYDLSTIELFAGDINEDQIIDITDILYVRAHILGTYNIHE